MGRDWELSTICVVLDAVKTAFQEMWMRSLIQEDPHAMGQLSLCATITELVPWSP